ncbi:MAG: HTTM domain-containing protein [Acidobacteriota bacterium]
MSRRDGAFAIGSSWIEAWDRFWFVPIPPHVYALLRMLYGVLGLANLIALDDIRTYWAFDGLVPREDYGPGLKTVIASLGWTELGPAMVYAGCVAAFAAMTIGIFTRASVGLALAAALVHQSWNVLPLSNAQLVLQGVLFCLVWADCGAVWSADAWLARRRLLRTVGTTAPPITCHPIAPLRLVRFQIALIYLSSGLWKLQSPPWRDGSTLHYVLNTNVFHRFPIAYGPAWDWVFTTVTYVTLFWELAFAFAILFTPTRRLALIAGVLMHLGMLATLSIGPFSLVMLAAYVAFLDPRWVGSLPRPVAMTTVTHGSAAEDCRPGARSTREPADASPHIIRQTGGIVVLS